jgi:hypothetical protein
MQTHAFSQNDPKKNMSMICNRVLILMTCVSAHARRPGMKKALRPCFGSVVSSLHLHLLRLASRCELNSN